MQWFLADKTVVIHLLVLTVCTVVASRVYVCVCTVQRDRVCLQWQTAINQTMHKFPLNMHAIKIHCI